MFNFFRDVALELNGIDTAKAKNERDEKREQEKLSRFIFTKGARRAVITLGFIYVPLSILSIFGAVSEADYFNAQVVFQLTKNILLLLLCVGVCIALFIGGKKGEVFALIGGIVFVILLYLVFIVL